MGAKGSERTTQHGAVAAGLQECSRPLLTRLQAPTGSHFKLPTPPLRLCAAKFAWHHRIHVLPQSWITHPIVGTWLPVFSCDQTAWLYVMSSVALG